MLLKVCSMDQYQSMDCLMPVSHLISTETEIRHRNLDIIILHMLDIIFF